MFQSIRNETAWGSHSYAEIRHTCKFSHCPMKRDVSQRKVLRALKPSHGKAIAEVTSKRRKNVRIEQKK